MPSAAAPTVERNTSSVPIAVWKPRPGSPTRRSAGTRTASNASVASGCGEMTSSRSWMDSPGASPSTRNAESPRAPGCLAGAGEDDVAIGDPAVRDPGLDAVDDVAVPVAPRRGREGGDVGAGLGLGQRERGDRPPGRDLAEAARPAGRPSRTGSRGRCRVPAWRTRSRPDRRGRRASRARCRASARRARRSARRGAAGRSRRGAPRARGRPRRRPPRRGPGRRGSARTRPLPRRARGGVRPGTASPGRSGRASQSPSKTGRSRATKAW